MTTDADEPPEWNDGTAPDRLRGYRKAGERLSEVMTDAEHRLILAPETFKVKRFGDIQIHTQARQDYANRLEKSRIMAGALQILNETLTVKDPTSIARFQEAIAALRNEEERIFVVVLTGTPWTFVYWNWRYGYALDGVGRNLEQRVFHKDVRQHRVASPELARQRYGSAVVHTKRCQSPVNDGSSTVIPSRSHAGRQREPETMTRGRTYRLRIASDSDKARASRAIDVMSTTPLDVVAQALRAVSSKGQSTKQYRMEIDGKLYGNPPGRSHPNVRRGQTTSLEKALGQAISFHFRSDLSRKTGYTVYFEHVFPLPMATRGSPAARRYRRRNPSRTNAKRLG